MLPFRAWRYSPQAGDLGSLIAPPYDVIGPALQSALHERSPYNVVRVDLGLGSSSDGDPDNRYTRAARALTEWKTSGVLTRDIEPTLTFVEEEFTGPDGRAGSRHGVLAVLRLSKFGDGVVYPHEHTLTGPKEDRYRLMDATAMSLSPVFLLYDLPGDDITAAWRESLAPEPPTSTVVDDTGNTTRLWATSDPDLLQSVTRCLTDGRFLVADGHHRYETALRYQRAQGARLAAAAGEDAPAGERASDYCLVYLANKSDPALAIYPTHRLVHGLTDEAVRSLPGALADTFEVERLVGTGAGDAGAGDAGAARAAAAHTAIDAFLRSHQHGAFGLWGPGLDAAYGVSLADMAQAHVSTEHSEAYQELDVAILQTLVLQKTLGISAEDVTSGDQVTYFKDTAEAFPEVAGRRVPAGLLHERHRPGASLRGGFRRRADATEDHVLLSKTPHRTAVSRSGRRALDNAIRTGASGSGAHLQRFYA